MGEDRPLPPHGVIDERLARGVVQVVVAADDVGDPHVVVVGHHGEVVGRSPVRAQQHQVVQVLGGEADLALDGV